MTLAKPGGSQISVTVKDMATENLAQKDPQTAIRQFILKKFPLARKLQIAESDALLESGMLDSQGVLEVVAFIEQEFLITVADDDLIPENFETITRIAGYVRSRQSGNDVASA